MVGQRTSDEAAIRRRLDTLVSAVRAADLEGLKSIYAPDIVSFDIEPPLRHVGAEAKWRNWEKVFTIYQRPLGYEIRDLIVTVGGDVAFAYSLARLSGTLRNGNKSGYWVRWTTCLCRVNDNWLIAHDQISVPVDFATGRALLDLEA
jgi:ketosteroid isomerase-like protein